MSYDVPGLDWSNDRMLPAFQSVEHLTVYDLRNATSDIQLAVTTLVGCVNRPRPQVYLLTRDDDLAWLNQVAQAIPQTRAPQTGESVLIALLDAYQTNIDGLIIYDPALVDTINVATAMAGQYNGCVVSPALASELQKTRTLRVLDDLRTYKWQSRVQAYQWAQQHLLNGASSRFVAGLDPQNVTGLRSFLVATRTFVYWLDARQYIPNPTSGVLAERVVMEQLYSSFVPGTIHLGWFIDEPSGVTLTSQAGIPVLACDFFYNLEVWTALPPAQATHTQPQIEVHTPAASNKVYVAFTMSDGDNLQYCQHRLKTLWGDPVRGELPIGWTIAPTLLQAAPALAQFYLNSATSNDEWVVGPSGAGYIFPSAYLAAQLPPFLHRTGRLMQAWNSVTLEVLDTDLLYSSGLIPTVSLSGMAFTDARCQQEFVAGLTPYGLRGILSGAGFLLSNGSWQSVAGVPLYRNLGLADSVEKTVQLIQRAAAAQTQRPLFLSVYVMAWSMSPSTLRTVMQQLGANYEVVLPRTLMSMLAASL